MNIFADYRIFQVQFRLDLLWSFTPGNTVGKVSTCNFLLPQLLAKIQTYVQLIVHIELLNPATNRKVAINYDKFLFNQLFLTILL